MVEMIDIERIESINDFIVVNRAFVVAQYDYRGIAEEFCEETGTDLFFVKTIISCFEDAYFSSRCSEDDDFGTPTSMQYAIDTCKLIGIDPQLYWGVLNDYLCDAYEDGRRDADLEQRAMEEMKIYHVE